MAGPILYRDCFTLQNVLVIGEILMVENFDLLCYVILEMRSGAEPEKIIYEILSPFQTIGQ
jgi:hypothetical protein